MPHRMFPIIHLSKMIRLSAPLFRRVVIRITLMLIRIRIWIRLITLMRIWIQIFLFDADPDADPDPTFHPDADPDPDPSFKKRLKLVKFESAKIGLYSIHFGLTSAN
jgi:hypothetical protein